MTDPIYIKASCELMPPLFSELTALKLWQRLERNPCRDADEQKLYEAITKRFLMLASLCFVTSEDCTPEQP